MKGHTVTWLRVGLVVAVVIAAHAVHAGSADAAPVTPAPGAVLLGAVTSQNMPAVFRVAGDGRTLTLAEIAVGMTCTSGAHFVLSDGFVRVPISKSGRLRVDYSQPATVGSGGTTYAVTDSVTGRLNRAHTKLSGVWRLSIDYSYTDGTTDHCDSGSVQFTAIP
jgi:hypothetical protein